MEPQKRSIRGWFVLLGCVWLGGVPAIFADSSSLIQRAETDLAATREIAASVTNEQERVMWQKRIELSEKELENVRQRVELEQREVQLAEEQTRLGARHNLREALRRVEFDTKDDEARAVTLDREIRRLQSQRTALAGATGETDTEKGIEEQSERDQRLQTVDAELRARILERDAADHRIRLGQEATRIDQALRAREINPRPSIRQVMDTRKEADASEKSADDIKMLRENTQKNRDAVAETVGLAETRFSSLDEEIKTLETLYSTGRKSVFDFSKTDSQLVQRQKQVLHMLSDSRNQRRYLEKRIEFQRAQLTAMDESLASLDSLHGLLVREHEFMLSEKTEIVRRFMQRISVPAIVLAVLFVLHFILRRIILPLALRSENLFVARRAVTYLTGLVSVVVLTLFFLEDLKSIATILGIAGAAVVIALQDLCSAFAGWFVILTSRKIQVGDRIEVDGHRGDVVDIQLLRTTLLEVGSWMGSDEPTGRIVVIPNSFIFKSQFFNYSHVHPYTWGKVEVTVTYESPAKAAFELFMRVLKEETQADFDQARNAAKTMEDRYGVPDATYEPRILSSLHANGLTFSLFYVCHYKQDDEARNRLTRRILQELEKDPRIRIAYPTQRELHEPNPVSYDHSQHK